MFKKLALALTTLLLGAALQAATIEDPTYVTNPPVTFGVLTVTPNTPDVSRNAIEIGKIIYLENEYDPIFTTLTLQLQQDEKGKVVGNANFVTSRQVNGRPDVSFPIDVPVVGKLKGNTIKLKGKLKISEGEGGKKRNVKMKINGELIGFSPVDLNQQNISTFDDLQSDATYRFQVNIGGLGYNYNYVQDAVNKGRYLFIYQVLEPEEALGLKFPKGGDLYKVWLPWGVTLAKGYVAVDEFQNTVLTLKGKKFQYTGVHTGGNGEAPFNPDAITLKTAYSNVFIAAPDLMTLLAFFEIFHAGNV